MRAYHFLSAVHALSSIEKKQIKISRIKDLNDPFELMAGLLADRKVRGAVQKLKEHWDKGMGLLCFSSYRTDPVIWSHYASKHTGVALGFEISEEFVIPIKYIKDRLDTPIYNNNALSAVNEQYIRELLSTKYVRWEYENEVRIYVGLDEGTQIDGLYFYPFDVHVQLREVILGAMCKLDVKEVRKLVREKYKNVNVLTARMAFNSFNIVLDQRSVRRS